MSSFNYKPKRIGRCSIRPKMRVRGRQSKLDADDNTRSLHNNYTDRFFYYYSPTYWTHGIPTRAFNLFDAPLKRSSHREIQMNSMFFQKGSLPWSYSWCCRQWCWGSCHDHRVAPVWSPLTFRLLTAIERAFSIFSSNSQNFWELGNSTNLGRHNHKRMAHASFQCRWDSRSQKMVRDCLWAARALGFQPLIQNQFGGKLI